MTELEVLYTYINENLIKELISKSKSLAGLPNLLIRKKDRLDRLYVNFRAINTIMIKDRYLLPNISKLKD
jgi:hypothetical protein